MLCAVRVGQFSRILPSIRFAATSCVLGKPVPSSSIAVASTDASPCDVPKGAFGVLVVEGVAEYAVHDGVEVSAQYLVGIFSVQVYHPRGVEPEKAPSVSNALS